MKENKFCININPAPTIPAEDWYLGCIRDLVAELRKFEEVKLYGQERLDTLKDKPTKERILAAIQFKEYALGIAGEKLANDDNFTFDEYKKKVAEINKTYDDWISSIETD